jgi:hypothetical protein
MGPHPLGKTFDITHQPERGVNEYRQALGRRTTHEALDEAAKYIEAPYELK